MYPVVKGRGRLVGGHGRASQRSWGGASKGLRDITRQKSGPPGGTGGVLTANPETPWGEEGGESVEIGVCSERMPRHHMAKEWAFQRSWGVSSQQTPGHRNAKKWGSRRNWEVCSQRTPTHHKAEQWPSNRRCNVPCGGFALGFSSYNITVFEEERFLQVIDTSPVCFNNSAFLVPPLCHRHPMTFIRTLASKTPDAT